MHESGKSSPTTAGPRRRRPSRAERGTAALDLIARHGAAVLGTAKRYSSNPEDAEDAYQRGLEILLTKAPSTSEEELVPWLKTVVKHEAFALRRQRDRALLTGDDVIERAPDPGGAAHEQAERYDRLRVGAEAMQRLKPQEIRCLLLKAEGYSYDQICAETGFTYTKVNRCLTEGRRSFFERVSSIEAGAECRRMTPLLSALADGEATPGDMATLRPHLRACSSCRATLKEYRSVPARVAALCPPLALLGIGPGSSSLRDGWEALVGWLQESGSELVRGAQERGSAVNGRLQERGSELSGRLQERGSELSGRLQERGSELMVRAQDRLTDLGGRAQASAEVLSAQKVAAVAASTAALAGGGVATVRSLDRPAKPPGEQVADAGAGAPKKPSKARPAAALTARIPAPPAAAEGAAQPPRATRRRSPDAARRRERDSAERRARPAPQPAEFEPAPASYNPAPASPSAAAPPAPAAVPAPQPSGGGGGGGGGGPPGGEFAP